MDWEDFFCVTGMVTWLVAGVIVIGLAITALTRPAPRLVGYGCAGSSGPLYAYEEDAFPLCKEIRRK